MPRYLVKNLSVQVSLSTYSGGGQGRKEGGREGGERGEQRARESQRGKESLI